MKLPKKLYLLSTTIEGQTIDTYHFSSKKKLEKYLHKFAQDNWVNFGVPGPMPEDRDLAINKFISHVESSESDVGMLIERTKLTIKDVDPPYIP